jgi:DNA-binding response OmpR family regulator/DNA-binding MarR family transcriptional regulator
MPSSHVGIKSPFEAWYPNALQTVDLEVGAALAAPARGGRAHGHGESHTVRANPILGGLRHEYFVARACARASFCGLQVPCCALSPKNIGIHATRFLKPEFSPIRSQCDRRCIHWMWFIACNPASLYPLINIMAEVLLLDDDLGMLVFLEGILSHAGYICHIQTDPQAALSQVAFRQEIGLVLSDVYMPGLTGLQFINRLHGLRLGRPVPPVLLLTAQPSIESAIDALRLGAGDFLLKPVRPAELIEAVAHALSRSRTDRTVGTMRSPQIDQLVQQAEELAGRLRNLADARDVEPVDTPAPALTAPQVNGKTATGHPADGEAAVDRRAVEEPAALLSVLDTIEQLRRLRDLYAHHSLDDVEWDLLLELLRSERLQQRMSVSALTIVVRGASTTTSLRRINQLVARSYIVRIPDASDARRDFVSLTSKSNDLLTDYLTRANAHLRDLLA